MHLCFKIFPGPSVGLALCLTLKMPPLAQPQVDLVFVKRAKMGRIKGVEGMGDISPTVFDQENGLSCEIIFAPPPPVKFSHNPIMHAQFESLEPAKVGFCFHCLY